MAELAFMARISWSIAVGLAVLGSVLWFALPIRPLFPPYLVTALAAAGYGEFCRRRALALRSKS